MTSSRWRALAGEVRRRKVFRVGVVYAATAFVVLQAADLILPALPLPDWTYRLIVLLALFGFPVALALAWVLELTPDGVRVTTAAPADADGRPPSLLGRRTVLVAGALVVLGTGIGAGWFLRPAPRDIARSAGTADAKSLAVLAFADLSEAGDQKWFADGLAEEVLTSLALLPELRVIGRNSSFLFTAGAVDDRVIADTLGVAHLVKGSVRRVGERIRVSAQLVRAGDGVQLWSGAYDRDAADLLDVQRDVAEKVAAALDIVLDDERREAMFAAGTRSPEAFDAFLRGQELFRLAHEPGSGVTLADANERFARALALDSGFARAAFLHADRYGHIAVDGPQDRRVGPHDLSPAQAMARFRATFEPVVRHARDPHVRVLAALNRAFFSPDWRSLPGLLDELPIHSAAGPHSMGDTWGRHAWLVLGRIELSRELSARMVSADPIDPLAWSHRIQTEMAAGDLAAARSLFLEAGRHLGQLTGVSNWFGGHELSIALLEGDRDAVLALTDDTRDPEGFGAAVRGDARTALERAAAYEAARSWPDPRLLRTYHELGERDRVRELVRRIDALPSGPVMLARELSLTGLALTFDLGDAPAFAARLREAGIDPGVFRTLPRIGTRRGSP